MTQREKPKRFYKKWYCVFPQTKRYIPFLSGQIYMLTDDLRHTHTLPKITL